MPSEVHVPVYLGKIFSQEDEWERRVLHLPIEITAVSFESCCVRNCTF